MRLAAASAWIAFWTGATFNSIGNPPVCKPTTAETVYAVLALMAVPTLLAYLAGRDSRDGKQEAR